MSDSRISDWLCEHSGGKTCHSECLLMHIPFHEGDMSLEDMICFPVAAMRAFEHPETARPLENIVRS